MSKIAYKLILFSVVTAVFLLYGVKVSANGGFFPSDNYVIEGDQKAFIYYHDGIEDLVISASYYGDASDFAWIMPTPNQPEIFKSNSKLFQNLENITGSIEYDRGDGSLSFDATSESEKEVEVIEEKTIDIYNTAVLKASNEYALVDWLNENGYKFPQESSHQLSEYVNKNWYYAVVKIRPDLENLSEIEDDLYSGSVTPLRFSFQTDEIIYPMKLTKVALDYSSKMYDQQEAENEEQFLREFYQQNGIDVTIYVLNKDKVQTSQLDLYWANWLKPNEINSLEEEGQDWLKSDDKLFLTKFYSFVNTDKIDQDYLFYQDENIKYPIPVYQTGQFWIWLFLSIIIVDLVILLSPIGLIFIILLIIQHYAKKNSGAYLVSCIFQILISALLFLMTTYYVFDQLVLGYTQSDNQSQTWGILFAFAFASILSLLIAIKKFMYRSKQ